MNLLWREKYTEAMLELNPEELPARIVAAEKVIHQRIEELESRNKNSEEELWALNDALRGLRLLSQAECRTLPSQNPGKPQPQEAS